MKFGKSFEKALEGEDIPEEWRSAAIQYKALKKCINRVVTELDSLGLRTEMIQSLLEQSTNNVDGATVEYTFDGTTRSIEPKLVLLVDREGPLIEELSATTRAALEDLLDNARTEKAEANSAANITEICENEKGSRYNIDCRHSQSSILPDPMSTVNISKQQQNSQSRQAVTLDTSTCDPLSEGDRSRIQIKLDADQEFFQMLSSEVYKLDKIQSQEKRVLVDQITSLGTNLSALVRPDNVGKSNPDLYAWRELFRLYIDAGVLNPVSEKQRKEHTPEKAAKQLTWFANEVEEKGILNTHRRNGKSKGLYETFNAINLTILRDIRFQQMNKDAMGKILKKFDKRTALTAKTNFTEFMAEDPFFKSGLAQAMHYTIASNLMSIVPQLEDYECPVCTSITMKPVRLRCSHVFCLRCLVKLQLQGEQHCPICRAPDVMKADSTNIDYALLNFLKLYFPVEAKAKQKENEAEALRAQLERAGINPDKKCLLM